MRILALALTGLLLVGCAAAQRDPQIAGGSSSPSAPPRASAPRAALPDHPDFFEPPSPPPREVDGVVTLEEDPTAVDSPPHALATTPRTPRRHELPLGASSIAFSSRGGSRGGGGGGFASTPSSHFSAGAAPVRSVSSGGRR